MTLSSIVAGAFLVIAPSYAEEPEKEIAFADRPIEYRACPPESEYNKPTELANGKVVTSIPSRFCYEEPLNGVIYKLKKGEEEFTRAKVYYTEEGTVKRDAWSNRNGYPSMTRQFIIEYGEDNVESIFEGMSRTDEIWFISNPSADGRGLTDRVGGERIYFTRKEENQIRAHDENSAVTIIINEAQKNKYTWFHGEVYEGVSGSEENIWQSDALIPIVTKIMRFMRRQGYQAHNALKEYSIDYEPERIPNPDPILLTDKELIQLHKLTKKLYEKADKIEKEEEEKAARKRAN